LRAASDVVLMMLPPPWRFISITAAFDAATTLRMLSA
jgi:hypothetical protein